MKLFLLAGILTCVFTAFGPSTASSAIASITYHARPGWGQWVVARSKGNLDATLNFLRRKNGGFSVDLRCNGTGWVAQVHSNYPQAEGYACGFSTPRAAEAAARRECRSRGGTQCDRVFIRYDSGTYQMKNDTQDPEYHLGCRNIVSSCWDMP